MFEDVHEGQTLEDPGQELSDSKYNDLIKWLPIVVPLLAVVVGVSWVAILDAVVVHA